MGTRAPLLRYCLLIKAFAMAAGTAKLFLPPGSPRSLGNLFARLAFAELLPAWFVATTAALFLAALLELLARTPREETLEQRSFDEHVRA